MKSKTTFNVAIFNFHPPTQPPTIAAHADIGGRPYQSPETKRLMGELRTNWGELGKMATVAAVTLMVTLTITLSVNFRKDIDLTSSQVHATGALTAASTPEQDFVSAARLFLAACAQYLDQGDMPAAAQPRIRQASFKKPKVAAKQNRPMPPTATRVAKRIPCQGMSAERVIPVIYGYTGSSEDMYAQTSTSNTDSPCQ